SISLQLAGTNKLIKAGTATLTLSASNSYSGGTLLSAGNVKVAVTNANSVFGLGDVTVASGVQIWDNVASASGRVWNNNLTIAGDGGSGAGAGANTGVIYLNSGVDLVLNGTLTLSDDSRLTAANSVNVGYVLNGDVNLDAYTLTLRGGSTSLQTDWAINGDVSGAGGGGLAWNAGNPNSMLTLSGSNTYSGLTTNNAILSITSTNALPGWDTAGRYSISGAGTLAVGNDVDDSSILTILGTGNLAANAKIGFYTAAGDRNCPLNLSDTGAGALGVTKVANNTLTLSGLNTYTGVTKVNGGVLLIPATTALPGWDTDGRYSVASGATLAVANAVSDADIATILATTNFVSGARIGFDTTAGNRTYPNILANTSAGSLGVQKLGNNTLTLAAVNTYSGATVVSGGVLTVNGSTAGGSVAVSSNATLSGYGLIKGAVTIQGGGTLSLGSSIGVLTISNGLTLQANSATVMKLAKGSSPANDQVGGIRTLTYGGTLTVTTNVGMAALAAGDSFQLFQATNFVGSFQATNLPALAAGLVWDTSTLSNGVLSVVASSVTVPPPAVLTSATRSGNNLVLVWNGGTNSSGTLLTATNVAQSLATWTPVWTNAVGADGLSTNTLPINLGEPKRFYLLSIP
ncbi:MAG: beta strand repeat-containing protein, partial [Verrucomicrobiota bacterium]